MRAGLLLMQVELWKKTVQRDTFGGSTEIWKYSCTMRSYVKDRNGRSDFVTDEVFNKNNIEVMVRNHYNIKRHDRIKYNGDMYIIDFIRPEPTYRRELLIRASRLNE